jgi:hypothetical protein
VSTGTKLAPVLINDRSVDRQEEIDNASADQEVAGVVDAARRGQSGQAEELVDDVVQDADLEEPDQLGLRLVPGEGQLAVVGRDAGDESEDGDEQERRADGERRELDE